jgi:hypothetical protein
MNHLIARGTCVVLALVSLTSSPSRTRADEPRQPAAKVTFLDVDAAKAAIVDDSKDPYFERLTPTEMTVKTGRPITGATREEQLKETKARYQAAVMAFTDEDRELISNLIAQVDPALRREMPRFADQPWSFIKVNGTIEGGMGHTRGGHIVLPVPMLQMLRFWRGAEPAGGPAGGVLVHEQTHVIERAHPEWFTKLYTDVLGFQKAKHIVSDPWIAARHVVNPDGPDVSWVMPIKSEDGSTRWVWPLILLGGPDATSFRGMEKVAFDLEPGENGNFRVKLGADGVPVHEPLDDVQAYAKAVRTPQSSYHPNEIAADLVAKLVTSHAETGEDELKDVRDWARTAFAAPR